LKLVAKSPSRPAFTLFQLLALIALFAFLLGLLLPAVAKVRAAAARAQSSNNIRQIGIALHNYHDTAACLPEGCDRNHFSAAARLLPYIEQDNLFRNIDFTKPISDEKNKQVRETLIRIPLLSPRDPLEPSAKGYAPTNFLFNAGSKPSLTDNDGIFYMNSAVRFADVTDGLSNTLFVGETLRGDAKAKPGDLKRHHVALKKTALKDLKDDAGVKDFQAGKNIASDRCAAWIDGRFLKGTFTGTRKINDPRPDVDCEGEGGLSGLRSLDNGCNVGFADGSSRYIVDTVNADVWRLLTSRNDGQVIPNF
jgi:prepilin-type processing-associated H-X9-DG protein